MGKTPNEAAAASSQSSSAHEAYYVPVAVADGSSNSLLLLACSPSLLPRSAYCLPGLYWSPQAPPGPVKRPAASQATTGRTRLDFTLLLAARGPFPFLILKFECRIFFNSFQSVRIYDVLQMLSRRNVYDLRAAAALPCQPTLNLAR